MKLLLEANLDVYLPIARCFYLYALQELLDEVPQVAAQKDLSTRLEDLINKYGHTNIFAKIPLSFNNNELAPMLDIMGKNGGKEALICLIGQYAARPPIRTEMMNRLLTWDYPT